MDSFGELIRQGAGHAWLFIPSALLLGALHGLEPGHSKTMMAAFLVAVRGSVAQAVLLGVSAALSHTAVVWAVALVGLHYAGSLDAETSEPYFQLASGLIVVAIAAWMLWRTRREQDDHHHHHHHHHHGEGPRRLDTGQGTLTLEVIEDGVPPRWRLRRESGPDWQAADVTLETRRPDGSRQVFAFADHGGHLDSVETIPEPHEFEVRLRLAQGGRAHELRLDFHEHDHGHDQEHDHGAAGLPAGDAHARAHAEDIRRRFGSREVTTGQIVLFGLTGGLIPCPAAITILLLCLQLQEFTLGLTLVLCFSIGLAAVLVLVGVAAVLGMRHAERRWAGRFDRIVRRAPYLSGGVILLVGLALAARGWAMLPPGGP